MSSAPEALSWLGRKCRGGHRHQALVGRKAAQATIYPPQLRRAILRGAEAQHRREGRVLPEPVLQDMVATGMMGPAAGPAPTAGAGSAGGGRAQGFTYSKSAAWLLMPRSGGAIQPANLPGSVTGRMSDFT